MEMTASRRRNVTKVAVAAGGLLASATALALGLHAALDMPATLMSPSDYRDAKAAIQDESHFALDRCLSFEGTVFGICRAEALAEERTHRATLEARYLGTWEAEESARQVKADAAYDVAVAKCDEREGKERLSCLKAAATTRTEQLSRISQQS